MSVRCLSPRAHDHGATCQLHPPTQSQRHLSRYTLFRRRRSLPLGRRRSTRACFARELCHADCGVLRPYTKAPRRREVSVLWRTIVVRHASCSLQHQASAAYHTTQGCRRSLSLERRRSTRACCARAPYALVAFFPSRAIRKANAPARGLLLRAKHRGATSQLRPPTPSQRRVSRDAGTPALGVFGEEAQHSSLLRSRVMRAECGLSVSYEERCAEIKPVSLGRTTVVRHPSCSLQHQASAACHATQARRRSLSLGGGAALGLAAR